MEMSPALWLPALLLLAQAPAPEPLTRDALLEALQGGRDTAQLADIVRQQGSAFFPSAEDEAALRAAGAPPALVKALKTGYRPVGPPVEQDDLLLLIRLQPPRERLQRLIESRGVAFATTPQVGAAILEAGGDSALVGLVALNKRAPAAPPPPQIPPLPPDAVPFTRISPYDAATPAGVCDLRIRVDQDVEIHLRGGEIAYLVKRGAEPVPADSTCSQPLPDAPVRMDVRKMRGRGRVALVQIPDATNHFTARLLVEDPARGQRPVPHPYQLAKVSPGMCPAGPLTLKVWPPAASPLRSPHSGVPFRWPPWSPACAAMSCCASIRRQPRSTWFRWTGPATRAA
jgi:hypothetical protein